MLTFIFPLSALGTRPPATDPNCDDSTPEKAQKGHWCDLVVRQSDGSLKTRFDLVHSRLDKIANNGFDVMLVLDNVPWAFVNTTTSQSCKYGCQYAPPDDPTEFAKWVGSLASYLVKAYGQAYASNIQWRLATEANGPRWSNNGEFYQNYLDSYRLTSKSIRKVVPGARIGASNWVEQGKVEGSENPNSLDPNGTDSFQYQFYSAVAADPSVPLDWIAISHYGAKGMRTFPGADSVQRTYDNQGTSGQVEIQAMRTLAQV
jgi:hypothetical protein